MGFFDFIHSIWEFLGSVTLRQWVEVFGLLCLSGIAFVFLAGFLWLFSKFLAILGVASEQFVETAWKFFVALAVVGVIFAVVWTWRNKQTAAAIIATQMPNKEKPALQEKPPANPEINAQPVAPLPPNSICWTYELKDFAGTRWDVWDRIVKKMVGGKMEWEQFKADVIAYNPILVADEYEFFRRNTYLLPQLCP